MIKLFVKWFIKDKDNVEDNKVREKYGVLGGVLGIICNVILFVVKILIGFIMNSIAIMSDAFNNLSDTLSSIIGIFGAKLANKKPDKDHPFGHGRIEYVATLIVSFIILIVGFELLTSSVEKIISGIKGETSELSFAWISIIILGVSLFVKLWMFSYNRYLGKKINSSVLLATSADSISDVMTSSAVIISTILGFYLLKENYFYLDGGMGVIVAVIIFINGIKLVLETCNDLLGKPATEEEIEKIEKFLLSEKRILGCHDLIIHDYGPGRKIATVHCEVSDSEDVTEAHEIIDKLENQAFNIINMTLVIHMDPINTTNKEVIKLRSILDECIPSIDSSLSYHDLRITDGEFNINVIFDLVVPFEYTNKKTEDTIHAIRTKLKEKDTRYTCVIKIDHHF